MKIPRNLKNKLEELKIHKRQPYWEVVQDLYEEHISKEKEGDE